MLRSGGINTESTQVQLFPDFVGFAALLNRKQHSLTLSSSCDRAALYPVPLAAGEGRIQDTNHTHTLLPVTQQKLLLLFGVGKKHWCCLCCNMGEWETSPLHPLSQSSVGFQN